MALGALKRPNRTMGVDMVRSGARRHEEGQILPLTVLFLLVLLGVASLVVDGGMAFVHRRQMQNAADAAVLAAGALMVSGGPSDAQIISAATQYAQANGAQSITASYIDAAGQVLGQAGQGSIPSGTTGLQVQTARQYTPGIGAVVGWGQMTIRASAKGGIRGGAANSTILALSSDACSGLKATGSGTVTANGGNIHVNATCSKALAQTGSGQLRTTNGGQITVVGGYSKTGSGTAQPPPVTGSATLPDPLASVQPPVIGDYPVRHGTPSNPDTLLITGSSKVTLLPGVYYGGIRVTGSGAVTLSPGVYIIAGGEFKFTGSGAVTANGIFVYLTNDPAKPTGDGAYATLTITGSGGSSYSPMTSGPYKNLTFFQDRQNSKAADLTGSGELFTGTVYLPKAHLTMTGSGLLSGRAQMIVDAITLTGSGDMNFTYDASKFYGVPKAVLIN